MTIVFETIRDLKKHICLDRRKEDFEKILAIQKENKYIDIIVKTKNHDHVESLEDLRYWYDVYQGKSTINGVVLFSRCTELSQKYGTHFVFEHVPIKNPTKEERMEKIRLEILQMKEGKNNGNKESTNN